MKKFKVGLIGAGWVAGLHLSACKAEPERLAVTAICDPNEEILKQRADEYGISQRYTSLELFIQNSGVDVVVVCTPTSVRKQIVLPLLEAGFPLFVEKPFSDTLDDAVEITEKAKLLGIPVAVNQNFRKHYTFNIVKKIAAEHIIGKVIMIQFNNIYFRQDTGWRLDCERNALSVMGIHWLDGFRHVLGCEAESVVSFMSSSAVKGYKGETDAAVQIKFENGTMVSYTQSFSSMISRAEMIVIGETGTLRCDGNSVELFRDSNEKPSQRWENNFSGAETSLDNLKEFLLWVETGIKPSISAEDNLKTVTLLEAAYISAKENRMVHLQSGVLV